MVSSARSGVPLVSTDPTASTNGLVAGEFSDRDVGPLLPADTTTTTPLRHAASTAWASGSLRYGTSLSTPNERLATRMFRPWRFRLRTTQSRPSRMLATLVLP